MNWLPDISVALPAIETFPKKPQKSNAACSGAELRLLTIVKASSDHKRAELVQTQVTAFNSAVAPRQLMRNRSR